ncbi:MAG: ComEA family DNA-binding protein [Acidobacteriota bacterium]
MKKLLVLIAIVAAVTALGTVVVSAAPVKGPAHASQASSAPLVDINSATAAQLKALPGIGDAYSAKIIAHRPYAKKDQLVSMGVIPQSEYNKIKDRIVAHQAK